MSGDNAQQLLKVYGSQVNEELEKIFNTPLERIIDSSPSEHAILAFERLREFTLRPGKRVRACLAAFAYDQASGSRFGKAGLVAGAALELTQSYLLIIDDIMDRSDLRRGQPSLHEIYRKEQADSHTADMIALSVGLVANHLLNIVLSSLEVPAERLVAAIKAMHKNLLTTGLGQIDDLYQSFDGEISEEDVIRKYAFKTSYYTFVNPMQVGMQLGGADSPEYMEESLKFGVPAGIAFQLHDDVLGIFGDQSTGKPGGDDIEEGKYTLLLNYAMQHAPKQDIDFMRSVIGKPSVSNRDLDRIRDILLSSGARQVADDKALAYAMDAKQALERSAFWDSQAKQTLSELIDYSISRRR